MTPREHYLEAERLLEWAKRASRADSEVHLAVTEAQVHALLATVQEGIQWSYDAQMAREALLEQAQQRLDKATAGRRSVPRLPEEGDSGWPGEHEGHA